MDYDVNGNPIYNYASGAAQGASVGSVIPGIGTGIGAAAGGLLGLWQTYQSMKGLDNLQNQPKPNYSISPELQSAYNRSQKMSNQGYTGTERAAFSQNLAMDNAAQQQRATNLMGGNLAGNVFAGIQARNINALGDFAAKDAGLHRQNIQYADSIGSQIQNQRNMATNADIQRRLMQEQALGAGLKTGTENIANAFGGLGALYARQRSTGPDAAATVAPSVGEYDPRPQNSNVYTDNPNNGIDLDQNQLDYRKNIYGY